MITLKSYEELRIDDQIWYFGMRCQVLEIFPARGRVLTFRIKSLTDPDKEGVYIIGGLAYCPVRVEVPGPERRNTIRISVSSESVNREEIIR